MTASLISKDGNEKSYKRARIAVSNLTAQPLANAFFSLLKEFETHNWTTNDKSLVKNARVEMDTLIAQRNRFAHDIWHLGHPNLPQPSPDTWHRIRTIGTPKHGLLTEFEEITIDQIRNLIHDAKRIDTNIRQLSLAGIASDDYRPELHMKFFIDESGKKQVVCILHNSNG